MWCSVFLRGRGSVLFLGRDSIVGGDDLDGVRAWRFFFGGRVVGIAEGRLVLWG